MSEDKFLIIGISGSNGAGKDSVGQILEKNFNFRFISMTDILRQDLINRGIPAERKNTRELSAQWRREKGLGVLVDKAIEIYRKSKNSNSGLVVSSLRNFGEADRIHELGGKVVWVDAKPELRYKRLQANLEARGKDRALDDRKTYEQFLDEEKAEMYRYSDDPATLSTIDVKAKADIFIENNSNKIEDLIEQVKNSLSLTAI